MGDVDEKVGDVPVKLKFEDMVEGQSYKYLNFWDPHKKCDAKANPPVTENCFNKGDVVGDDPDPWANSIFAQDKIFAFISDNKIKASIGLVKSDSEERSGYFALCPSTASFDATAVIDNIDTYCYWSGLRVRQMGLPSDIGFVNTTGAPVAEGKLVCTTSYSFLMKLIRKTFIPLFRKYQSFLSGGTW